MTTPPPDVFIDVAVPPDPLERVRQHREAARQILRHAGLDDASRGSALVRLIQNAREREHYAYLIIRAIVAEEDWWRDRPFTEADRYLADPLERRHRKLRAQGYSSCAHCLSPLSGPIDWEIWDQLRDAAHREVVAREGAVA